jgi:hypothetical protein
VRQVNSDLDDAFVELLDANDEACGTPQFVTINGKKYRAIIDEIGAAEILVAGGNTEGEAFRAKTRKADFAKEPLKGATIRQFTDGKKLEILSIIQRNGVEYEITAGDPMAE